MERYTPEQPASVASLDELLTFIVREHRRIANAIDGALPSPLAELTAAPTKPRNFMIVAADGTHWNPGSGKGVYAYYSSAWHFLG